MKRATIRLVIVDDEMPARRALRRLISDIPGFSLVAESDSGDEAVELIRTETPDLVLLDIHLLQTDGFAVIREIGIANMPHVIFITAHDEYAVRAFEVNALDYLLKPVSRERFVSALERARTAMARPASAQRPRLRTLLNEWQHASGNSEPSGNGQEAEIRRLLVHDRQEIKQLSLQSVKWFEAADHYVTVHASSGRYLIHESLSGLEARLPSNFVRIHRKRLVNASQVAKVTPLRFGSFQVVLQSGEKLRVSRSCRDALKHLLTK